MQSYKLHENKKNKTRDSIQLKVFIPTMATTGILNINYVDTCFEYKTLTKIYDVPTYKNLKKLRNQLKANASLVQCSLGGGHHGHLGLVIADKEYTTVSTTRYD